MGPLWDWMTHPFTRTPPGIAAAPADLSSAAVGPSHAAAEAICVVCFKLRNSQWQCCPLCTAAPGSYLSTVW